MRHCSARASKFALPLQSAEQLRNIKENHSEELGSDEGWR
jgi:hypothetical protein